ncbi:MAG: hypothetical protein CFE26_17440 [Verrucomicrobiales bacterium VVV1]|nr:MAG: hypothetical protein CFE26_17440 [Verrucomicrobiales bacterium VVV1]
MNTESTVHTIGFTKKTASEFFGLLKKSGTKRIVDVRLNNVSQLAGFSKRDDLRYFLKEIVGIDYVHEPLLAPTSDILDAYKKHKGDWRVYEPAFLELMRKREIEKRINPDTLKDGCLLCSEDKPHHCHRRLVAEYLRQKWGDLEIRHLV